jgi:hypothetical protein
MKPVIFPLIDVQFFKLLGRSALIQRAQAANTIAEY